MKTVTIECMDKQLRRLTIESQYTSRQVKELDDVVLSLNSKKYPYSTYILGLFYGLQFDKMPLYEYDFESSIYKKTKYHPDNKAVE